MTSVVVSFPFSQFSGKSEAFRSKAFVDKSPHSHRHKLAWRCTSETLVLQRGRPPSGTQIPGLSGLRDAVSKTKNRVKGDGRTVMSLSFSPCTKTGSLLCSCHRHGKTSLDSPFTPRVNILALVLPATTHVPRLKHFSCATCPSARPRGGAV